MRGWLGKEWLLLHHLRVLTEELRSLAERLLLEREHVLVLLRLLILEIIVLWENSVSSEPKAVIV